MPRYVDGVAIIRGRTVPVIRLACLLQAESAVEPTRLVVARVDGRQVAIGVDAVIGVFSLDRSILRSVPPLLKDASPELIASIGNLDGELLIVLQASRILPDELWSSLEAVQQTGP
jgi:purine-binding chemotaxis protein CheW